jgi:hypothetical protein
MKGLSDYAQMQQALGQQWLTESSKYFYLFSSRSTKYRRSLDLTHLQMRGPRVVTSKGTVRV